MADDTTPATPVTLGLNGLERNLVNTGLRLLLATEDDPEEIERLSCWSRACRCDRSWHPPWVGGAAPIHPLEGRCRISCGWAAVRAALTRATSLSTPGASLP